LYIDTDKALDRTDDGVGESCRDIPFFISHCVQNLWGSCGKKEKYKMKLYSKKNCSILFMIGSAV